MKTAETRRPDLLCAKMLLPALLVCASAVPVKAQATNYEYIRVDFGITGGYASGINEGGFGGVLEPKFLVTDNAAVALRLEGMVTFGADLEGTGVSYGTGSIGLIGIKGEYLLGTFGIRPQAGMGAGLYRIGGDTVHESVVSHKSGRYFGVSPQLGIDFWRVRLAATWHIIMGAAIEVEERVGGSIERRDFSQNYYTFELSFHVGGSRLEQVNPK